MSCRTPIAHFHSFKVVDPTALHIHCVHVGEHRHSVCWGSLLPQNVLALVPVVSVTQKDIIPPTRPAGQQVCWLEVC